LRCAAQRPAKFVYPSFISGDVKEIRIAKLLLGLRKSGLENIFDAGRTVCDKRSRNDTVHPFICPSVCTIDQAAAATCGRFDTLLQLVRLILTAARAQARTAVIVSAAIRGSRFDTDLLTKM